MGRTKELFQEVREYLAEQTELLEDGQIEELDLYEEIYLFSKDILAFKAHFEGYAIDEANKYSKDELKEMGFEYRKGARVYDFDEVPQVVRLKAELKEAQDASKQALKEPVFLNGKVLKAPIVTNKKDSLIVKKAK